MICFQISIFEPLNTASTCVSPLLYLLWFAFKLVSLSHWIQLRFLISSRALVVICFQISIFEPLNTALFGRSIYILVLWFAFKLVSLSHWIQPIDLRFWLLLVVICFQISIFEPLNTADAEGLPQVDRLWFAFKLVSLSHWIQPSSKLNK